MKYLNLIPLFIRGLDLVQNISFLKKITLVLLAKLRKGMTKVDRLSHICCEAAKSNQI